MTVFTYLYVLRHLGQHLSSPNPTIRLVRQLSLLTSGQSCNTLLP